MEVLSLIIGAALAVLAAAGAICIINRCLTHLNHGQELRAEVERAIEEHRKGCDPRLQTMSERILRDRPRADSGRPPRRNPPSRTPGGAEASGTVTVGVNPGCSAGGADGGGCGGF